MTQSQMYIAGIGMLTSVGGNAKMTAAAVEAGISGYQASKFSSTSGKKITMSNVPEEVFFEMNMELKKHHLFQPQHANIIKMALWALLELYCNSRCIKQLKTPPPLLLAMPEATPGIAQLPAQLLIDNLIEFSDFPFDPDKVHRIHSGRAAGIELLQLAHRYLFELDEPFVIIGGSDSYSSIPLMNQLEEQGRLLYEDQGDGFVPGEGSCFLLLCKDKNAATQINGQVVTVESTGVASELGHLNSPLPYKGEGLDTAFKMALKHYKGPLINTIYSSMNGESFWAKEQGVAIMRNKSALEDHFMIEHPMDCFGDIGAATGTVLMALSAMKLLQMNKPSAHLIYGSADGEKRAVTILKTQRTLNIKEGL